ncbi:MAG: hypothetical protein QM760_14980 [Nibricoccus sp.]
MNAFIMLSEKRNYLRFLSEGNQKSKEAINNYLSLLLLLLVIIDEITSKDFSFLDKVAKKCKVDRTKLMLAFQLKILFAIAVKRPMKDERLFEGVPVLHQYSEDTIKEAMHTILKGAANPMGRKDISLF